MVTIEPRTVERTWTAEGLPALTAKVTLPQPAVPADAFARRLRAGIPSQIARRLFSF